MDSELTISRPELVEQAKKMGLKFAPATGVEKLKTMIEDAQNKMVAAEGAEDITAPFDEEKYRIEAEAKARIDAEARVKVEFEMKPPKVDPKRKLSPEEIITKTHPTVDIIFNNGDESDTPLHCTYGGVRYLMFPSKSYEVPYGFADHLQYHCQYPVFSQVPDPDAPGETKPKRTGWKPRFNIRIADNQQYANAEEKAKGLGYVPIRERQENEKT